MAPAQTPDFGHVRSWIFDLDNTLYRADNGVFAQIEARLTDYVERLLNLPRDAARAVQKDLYRQYGTTLNGLMREHELLGQRGPVHQRRPSRTADSGARRSAALSPCAPAWQRASRNAST